MHRLLERPGQLQGWFYVGGALWALLAYRSFELVTGPKREPWLVKTVAGLMLPIAAALLADPAGSTAAARRVGIGSAAAFALVDVWYAGVRRRIAPVYLVDAAAEIGLIALWLRRLRDSPQRDTRPVG